MHLNMQTSSGVKPLSLRQVLDEAVDQIMGVEAFGRALGCSSFLCASDKGQHAAMTVSSGPEIGQGPSGFPVVNATKLFICA